MAEKAKSLMKEGWEHRPVHRKTWKEDLKGVATGKKSDPYETSRNHQSTPLSSLRDPDAFGPPPKHSHYHPDGQRSSTGSPNTLQGPQGGLGSVVPTSSRTRQQEQEQEQALQAQEQAAASPVPFRVNTSGLRTDNLPKPPVRRTDGTESPVPPSPALPPRHGAGHSPVVPPRQSTGLPPMLPPRQKEYPDESTPAPPPTYREAIKTNTDAGHVNPDAAHRLGHAGVSVPDFDIGAKSTPAEPPAAPRGPQLSELQQRFARMSAGAQASPPLSPTQATSATGKKAPPPRPPKKVGLTTVPGSLPNTSDGNQPPPLPLSSKPRPS